VYDILNYNLSSSVQDVMADLLQTTGKTIKVEHVNVQHQKGGNDCGLFAIATAYTFCSNENPVQCSYDQNSMRLHLLKAFENNKLEAFPSKARRVKH